MTGDSLFITPGSRIATTDDWLAKDKFDHFSVSAFLVGFGYFAAHKELQQSEPSAQNIAFAFSLTLGLGKECYDKLSQKGTPSYKDFIANILGAATGFLFIHAKSR